MIKKHVGRGALIMAVLLGLCFLLLAVEWPLPKFARHWIEEQLAKESIQLEYREGHFDLLGNVRLEGATGHYQGLLGFSARQILVRLFSPGGMELIVDSGDFHTGFLQIPIPETIHFAGSLQRNGNTIEFHFLRLKAGSLVGLIRGSVPLEKHVELPVSSNAANKIPQAIFEKEKKSAAIANLFASFVEKLCSGNKLWVAEADIDSGVGVLTLSGEQLQLDPANVTLPVLRVSYPFSALFLSADKLSADGAEIKNGSLSYSADEGALWRGMAQSVKAGKIEAKAISASLEWPIATISDKKTMGRLNAVVNLSDHSTLSLRDGSISPISAKVEGNIPAHVLRQFGLKLTGDAAGTLWGQVDGLSLKFNYRMGAGGFYGLPFNDLQAGGQLMLSGVNLDRFTIHGPGGWAQGAMNYDFSSRVANYLLSGKVDPVALPWFGSDWIDIFKPFGKISPYAALSLRTAPAEPTKADGIAFLKEPHHYNALPLDQNYVSFRFEPKISEVNFHAFSGNEKVGGRLSFEPSFSAEMQGDVLPVSMAKAYFPEIPEVLQNLNFSHTPHMQMTLGDGNYVAKIHTDQPVTFYNLDFSRLDATVASTQGQLRIDPVTFGFSGGDGGLTAQVNPAPTLSGYGSIWLRNANLGEWSLLGPLSQMLKSGFFAFTSLKFNSLDGSFTLEPEKVKIEQLNMWGTEHAANATGVINTQDKTLDFIVHLKTLGGSHPTLGVLAPIVQPLTSVIEAHLTGPIAKPTWKVGLGAP